MQSAETSRMLQLISGYQVSRALYVAAKLGLADLVANGTQDLAALAASTNTDAGSLLRLVRLLASVGVFAIDEESRIAMTPLADTLRGDACASLRGWAIGQLGDEHSLAWGDLLNSVRTGENAFQRLFGMSPWEYRAQHPASAQEFDEGMSSFLQAHAAAVIASYPFARFKRVIDLAGGDGQFLAALLLACPDVTGAVFELPNVADKAAKRLVDAGLTRRGAALAGNLFETLPAGADAYLLSRVIHDWSDHHAVTILRNCRKAALPDSTLLLIERVLPEHTDPCASMQALAVSDVNMLVMTGGRERTATQYRALLAAADWRMTRLVSTSTALSLIEAVPA